MKTENGDQKRIDRKQRELLSSPQLLNEAPDIIGKMTTVLENGGSLDTAVRELAQDGPAISRRFFRNIVDDADTRVESDIPASLSRLLSSVPESNSAYAMSVRMVISASNSKTAEERSRILKEASEIALNGLREAGKSFSSSLNTPCMAIFGLGIMVPMVLMSILPMMGMSGMFSSNLVDTPTLSVLTLVIIPAAVLCVVVSFKTKNPLRTDDAKGFPRAVSGFVMVPILVFILTNVLEDILTCIIISAIVSSAFAYSLARDGSEKDAKRRKTELKLQDAVFEIGNRLLTGESFEDSTYKTLSGRKECRELAEDFRNSITVFRGDVCEAIENVFGPVSSEISRAMTGIYKASVRNLSDAGRLAVSLGRQMKDRESLKKNIRNELKSMTDTMFGTASVFAPLVLGLSVSMLGPMRSITGMVDGTSTPYILTVYLVELCALISLLLGFIDGKGGPRDNVRRFSIMSAMSLTVFLISLNVGL